MNLLILSAGTRNKIVQYFKKELGGAGSVIATDCSELAPAIYEADKYYIVSPMIAEGYLEEIFDICKKENIGAVLSLIDPELSLLAKYKQEFLDLGVLPIVSDYNAVELCFDKFKMFRFLQENGFAAAKSYLERSKFYHDLENNEIAFPVFIKPVKGSASINISKVNTKDEIEILFQQHDNLMIQEFMDGTEYGADVYIDMISGEITAAFIKEKIKMRAGETDKSVSVKDEKLVRLICEFVKKTGLKGVIDIDIFKIDGTYYISEVNPRFGGGYPHAYESGVNIPKLIIDNVNGRIGQNQIGTYEEGIYMMKYNEITIMRK